MIAAEQLPQLYGSDVTDPNGAKIGTLGNLWIDRTGQPTWASVKTGLFGLNESLLPLEQAEFRGDHLQVPYTKDQVKDAPNVDASADEPLAEQDVAQLYQHYNLDSAGYGRGHTGTTPGYTGTTPGYTGTTPGYTGTTPGYADTTPGYAGTGLAGEQQEVGRARLRRYVQEPARGEQLESDLPDRENRNL